MIKKADLDKLAGTPSYFRIREKITFIIVPDDISIIDYYYGYTGLEAYL